MVMDLGVADAGNAMGPGARLVHPRAPGLSVVVHHLGSVLAYVDQLNTLQKSYLYQF